MTNRVATGHQGENIAREYLEEKGYEVLEQNWRTKYGEIDLIAKKGNTLVFVEVRTKTNEQFGTPEETLNYKKMAKLKRNAAAYTARVKWQDSTRIDAVCIVLNDERKPERLDHYENI